MAYIDPRLTDTELCAAAMRCSGHHVRTLAERLQTRRGQLDRIAQAIDKPPDPLAALATVAEITRED
jgi:hypothetical protein